MAGLIGNLLGSKNVSKQAGSQNQTTQRIQAARMRQLQDILTHILTGQAVAPPNTAISVPFQQAVSSAQGNMGRLNQQAQYGLAYAPPAADPAVMSGGNFGPGAGQAGLQTRAQLGLPDRSSYLGPFAPSPSDVAAAGVPRIRGGSGPLEGANQQLQGLATKIAAAGDRPGLLARLEKKQAALQSKKQRLTGASA